jgi:poly(3-hydroxybutyrate) depolymerase
MKKLSALTLGIAFMCTFTVDCQANKDYRNDKNPQNMNEISYTTPSGETGYIYIPNSVLNNPDIKVPMVLMMCGTGGDPRRSVQAAGWVEKALEENLIVIAPNYNNAATYSETGKLASVVEHMIKTYPADPRRVYSTGFSNGGATSVALCRDYPRLFAAISAMGWMVDMPDKNGVYAAYDMPFQVIQGTKEYTYTTSSGAMAIMNDEQRAIRSLFLFNEMIDELVRPDYDMAPYWGYAPDDTHSITPDGREWQINNYYKDSYSAPFAQFVLISEAGHTLNEYEATVAWDFFKNYVRDEDGSVKEN